MKPRQHAFRPPPTSGDRSALHLADPAATARDILHRCVKAGFAGAGIAPAAPSAWARELSDWLAAGRHGAMDYLTQDIEIRLDPSRLYPGTRAFIMVADRYSERGAVDAPAEEPRGRIARYSRGRNYHDVMKKRLHALCDQLRVEFPGSEYRSFVDTAPVLERELAVAAGLGWQAKNTMVIHPRLGSYVLLGGIATTLPLVPPPEQSVETDHCGTCTRCIDACPTGAIRPYSVDGSRCISYLTIEQRGAVPRELHRAMGEWIYGCDICQEVCPHNSAREGDVAGVNPAYSARHESFKLLDVLAWDPAGREDAFRSSAMKRANLAMMKRNALIVAGNWLAKREAPGLLARVRELAGDSQETELVRRTAAEVLQGLAAG